MVARSRAVRGVAPLVVAPGAASRRLAVVIFGAVFLSHLWSRKPLDSRTRAKCCRFSWSSCHVHPPTRSHRTRAAEWADATRVSSSQLCDLRGVGVGGVGRRRSERDSAPPRLPSNFDIQQNLTDSTILPGLAADGPSTRFGKPCAFVSPGRSPSENHDEHEIATEKSKTPRA